MKIIYEKTHPRDRSKEHLWTIALNMGLRIANIELVGLGSFRKVACEPAEVFSFPLQKKAASLILVHNHPSGELQPSESDIDTTDRLLQIGRFHNCMLLEHLIISQNSYYSFKDNGIIEKLKVSLKFVPSFLYKQWQEERKEEWKQEGEKLGIEKGKVEGLAEGLKKGAYQLALEIARKMILAEEPMEKIKVFTMLTPQQIGRMRQKIQRTDN